MKIVFILIKNIDSKDLDSRNVAFSWHSQGWSQLISIAINFVWKFERVFYFLKSIMHHDWQPSLKKLHNFKGWPLLNCQTVINHQSVPLTVWFSFLIVDFCAILSITLSLWRYVVCQTVKLLLISQYLLHISLSFLNFHRDWWNHIFVFMAQHS
jgi:hypothetical protein